MYVKLVPCSTLRIFSIFAADTFSKTHFSIFDNFRNVENVDDGGFGGSAAAFIGCLPPQCKSAVLLIVVCCLGFNAAPNASYASVLLCAIVIPSSCFFSSLLCFCISHLCLSLAFSFTSSVIRCAPHKTSVLLLVLLFPWCSCCSVVLGPPHETSADLSALPLSLFLPRCSA